MMVQEIELKDGLACTSVLYSCSYVIKLHVYLLTVNLRPKIDFHDVTVLQHGVVTAVRCVVCRHMVHRAAGGKPDSSLKTVNRENYSRCDAIMARNF